MGAALALNAAWPVYRRDLNNSGYVPGPTHPAHVRLDGLWSFTADSRITSTPTYANGLVYIGTWKGDVVALDALSGVVRWRAHLGAGNDWVYGGPRGVIGSVAIDAGTAYAASGNCMAAAYDALSGRRRWRSRVCDLSRNDDIYASPVVARGKVLIGVDMLEDRPTDRGRELALDARTGALVWTLYPQTYVGTGTGISATPCVDLSTGIAYLGTGNPTPATNPPPGDDTGSDSMLAFDVESGRELWSHGPVNPHDTRDQDFFGSPNRFAVSGAGVVRWLVGEPNKNGTYYALDARTGRLIWQRFVFAEPIGTPAVANGTIYVTAYADTDSSGSIAALRTSDGAIMWQHFTAGMYEAPVVFGNIVFATEATGWLDAYTGGTGALIGRWHIGGYLHGRGPSVVGDTLLLTTDRKLIAYKISS